MARKQLGKYDLIERLGRGGMAEVYKAYQVSLDRYVAIKLLHPFLADDPEFKDRFEREARNVARLRHPNIVQVYDFEYDTESESFYMVMELIDGETLKDRLTKLGDGLLPTEEALRIVREATEALAYAHARGMIHRDVKPPNLMIDNDGRVVLTDFGIAKIVTGHQFTASGGMIGTPAYMAPEQGLGEAGDERSDLYSLGVILFQLMTGQLPFDADTPLATILKHFNDPIPIPHEINPKVPTAVEQIILKAMAKDPEDRFQSAEAMLTALSAVTGPALTDTTRNASTKSASGGRKGGTGPLGSQRPPPPRSGSAPAVPSSSARRPAIVGLVAFIALAAIVGLITMSTGRVPLLGIAIRPSETFTPTLTPVATATTTPTNTATSRPTETVTATATITPTYTPSITDTFTPSVTLTDTPSNTPTSTATFTPSITPTNTATPTPTVTLTPSNTATPTPNITATIDAATIAVQNATATSVKQTLDVFFQTQSAGTTKTPDYTQTAFLCVKEYRQIITKPPDKDLIPADTDFERDIVLRNTSNCDWLPGAYLSYVSGERFSAAYKIEMKNTDPVKPNEDATFVFSGHTPKRGGPYSSQWELRLAGDILVNPPLTITFYTYE